MSWHLERFENKYKNEVFESSSVKTEQFKNFYSDFKKALRAAIRKYFPSWKIVSINDGHFEIFGFIKRHDGQMFYFNIGDVRWAIAGPWYDDVLFRTAENAKDYHGGINNRCSVHDLIERIATYRVTEESGMKA